MTRVNIRTILADSAQRARLLAGATDFIIAATREVRMPQPVTMAEIDALRGEALDLLDEIRARRGVDCSLLRLLLEALRDEIEEKLAQWWQQNGLVRR